MIQRKLIIFASLELLLADYELLPHPNKLNAVLIPSSLAALDCLKHCIAFALKLQELTIYTIILLPHLLILLLLRLILLRKLVVSSLKGFVRLYL